MSRDWINSVSSLPTVYVDQENNYGDQRAAKRRTSEPAITTAYNKRTSYTSYLNKFVITQQLEGYE
jgi:hypothetical protein